MKKESTKMHGHKVLRAVYQDGSTHGGATLLISNK